jgi:DeoR/GlpR family transcriptional regulator of sugar metabolism
MACENAIGTFHVDVALLSTTTVQGLSLYTQDEQVVRAKQAMMAIARKRILLVDSSKFRFTALMHVAQLTDFDVVLVAGDTNGVDLQLMRDAGVKLQLV